MNPCAKCKLGSKGVVHMDDDLVNCVIGDMSEHDLDKNHECFVAIEPENLFSTYGEFLKFIQLKVLFSKLRIYEEKLINGVLCQVCNQAPRRLKEDMT